MTQFLPAQAGAFPADVAPSPEAAQRPVAVTAGAMAEGRNTDFDALSRLSSDAVLLTVDGMRRPNMYLFPISALVPQGFSSVLTAGTTFMKNSVLS